MPSARFDFVNSPCQRAISQRGGAKASRIRSRKTAALAELERSDPEHPDCWLSDDAGWTVSVFESGLVTLENIESGEGPWHMRGVSTAIALELWILLRSGDLTALRAKTWQPGYGST
jgi:hypothetical protein